MERATKAANFIAIVIILAFIAGLMIAFPALVDSLPSPSFNGLP